MRPRILIVTVLAALALTAPARATPAPGTANLAVASGSPVALTALSPARNSGRTIALSASRPTRTGDAAVALKGSLRVGVGARETTLTSLRLEFGLVDASMTARLGSKRIAVFEIRAVRGKPLRVDGRAGTVRVDHAIVTLAPAAASRLKSVLRLRAMPSSGRSVGTLTLIAAATVQAPTTKKVAPVAQQQAQPALPQTGTILDNPGTGGDPPPAGDTTPPPGSAAPPPAATGPQAPTCATDPVLGTTDWSASGLSGSSDLKSWIDYIYEFDGAVYTYCDAIRVDPADPWDYSLPVVSVAQAPDGTVTIAHRGRISYFMAEHGIDMYVENPVVTVAADRASATVTATMQSESRDHPDDPPVVATLAVMTIDLSAASASSAGGVTTYAGAPAVLTAAGGDAWGYPAGRPWGTFTIAVPD